MEASGSGSSSSSSKFKVGDTVSVLRHGKAVIIFDAVTDAQHERFGRYQVKYLSDGTTYWVRPDSMRVFPKPPARVLVAETTKHYRSAALLYTHPDDVVLEVGCHEGVTTDMLHKRCKWVLGIDTATDPLDRAKARYPHVRFEHMDGFDIPALTALSPTGTYDKIFIDIGGIAELHIVMSLVGCYFRAFRQALLVVKNKYFQHLLGNAQVFVPEIEVQDKQAAAARKQQQQQQQQRQQQQQSQKTGQQNGQQQQQQGQQQQQEQQQQQLVESMRHIETAAEVETAAKE
ncbi:hypothetical protein OEZ85_002752 [Tetradesmus obliquus]|uniref:Methyltransferase domain-containing protein n=1 Tax=Tetradesmus obliquus TaxID=3088 RepID=A0ABY8U0Q6_TETOB|nr:hypothetical protein OEZ85_002752 [Tetradesmus obliquus]